MTNKNNCVILEASFIDENRYILGPGPVNAHIADEFITLESLNELEKQYLDIIKKCINNK